MTILSHTRRYATGAISTLLFLGIATTQAARANEDQFRQVMNKVGLPYQVTDNGAYKFNVPLSDGRTQLVFVSGDTEEVGPMKVREIYSAGFIGDRPLAGDVANQLLEDSERVKIGAWSVVQNGKRYIASFTVKMDATAKADHLKTAIVVAARRADEIEKKLTGKDDL